jgi:hypothetical protein
MFRLNNIGVSAGDGNVYEMEHEAFAPSDVVSQTEVVDSVGQRLTLKIENIRGGGGQRRISVYCPFWIINTTEYALMYKQEKGSSFVSGTVVSPDKDGSRPVDHSDRNYNVGRRGAIRSQMHISLQMPANRIGGFAGTSGALSSPLSPEEISLQGPANRTGGFAGTPGALSGPLSPEKIISLLDKDLPLDKLTEVAFMFNFQDEMLSLGRRELCVQLANGIGPSRYSSAWSHGFSLDSVGVNQVIR